MNIKNSRKINNKKVKSYRKLTNFNKSRKIKGGNLQRIKSRKYRGGILDAKVKNQIISEYKIPKKLVNQLGSLVNTEEEFFHNLNIVGLSYPKNKLPKTNDQYWDPEEYRSIVIDDEIEQNIYNGLFPINNNIVPDVKWSYVCGICPNDDDNCSISEAIQSINVLKPVDSININELTNKITYGCSKTVDYTELNQSIVNIVEQYQDHFVKYLYFLPWAIEGNQTFYLKSIDFGIQHDLLNREEKQVLLNSLSWKLLDCQPCIFFNENNIFCIDPFYLNESIEWVSNIYGEEHIGWNSSQQGLKTFKLKADENIQEYINKYDIDLERLKSNKPEWWVADLDKYSHDIYAVIIMFEQNENREIFQKIQFLMTIIKLLLTNYVVLHQDGAKIIEEVPLLDSYIVSSESTKYGCAASVAREIETKMNRLLLLFKTPGLEDCFEVYKKLDPFSDMKMKHEYVQKYNNFLNNFFLLINNVKHVISRIFHINLNDYRDFNSPLFLKYNEAENLGLCSKSVADLIEELSLHMVQQDL